MAGNWFVLSALVCTAFAHVFIEVPVSLVSCPELFNDKFLEHTNIDNVVHCHDLAEDVIAQLTRDRTITVVSENTEKSLDKVPSRH